MKERLKELRKNILQLSQKEFGAKISKKQNSIANYESGKRDIPLRTIKDICREYNINEEWLKNGKEPIFQENLSIIEMEKIKEKISKLTNEISPSTIRLLYTIAELTPEEWKVIEDFIHKIKR